MSEKLITRADAGCGEEMSLSLRAQLSAAGCVRLHPPDDFLHRSCCSKKRVFLLFPPSDTALFLDLAVKKAAMIS